MLFCESGLGVSLSEYISPLVGRLVLAWYFAAQAWMFGHRWDDSITDLAARHVPVPALVLVLALTVMLLGAVALVLGYHVRHGAMLLFALVLIASVALHDFWHLQGPPRDAEFAIFARNMAIAGGLLMIVGLGAGRFAIDNRGDRDR
jgi:putative oxidoreductase